MPVILTPLCCSKSAEYKVVEWREADNYGGPDKSGWTIISGTWGSDLSYINIDYCPFCGKTLPRINIR